MIEGTSFPAGEANNAGRRRDLSASHEKVGDGQDAHGDLAGALKSHGDRLAIRGRLARSDPGNARWRDLSVSYGKLAITLDKTGMKTEALDSLGKGREIVARLTQVLLASLSQ